MKKIIDAKKVVALICFGIGVILISTFPFRSSALGPCKKEKPYKEVSFSDFYQKLEASLGRWDSAEVDRQIKTFNENAGSFDNKADFAIFEKLFTSKTIDDDDIVIISGTFKGDAVESIWRLYKDNGKSVQIHGFEIMPETFNDTFARFADRANEIHIRHMGLSNHVGKSRVAVCDSVCEYGGLFEPTGRWDGLFNKNHEEEYVPVVTLDHFTKTTLKLDEKPVKYILIDVEGHEPNVIKGMNLELNSSQKLFPVFQFELGGTWADTRHDKTMPNLFSVALYLEDLGYDLYIIGFGELFRVSPAFFWLNHNFRENVKGATYYIPGNALAVSKEFADERIKQVINDNLFHQPSK